MSDKMRWRYGDTNPVVAAVDADTVIEIGDLVWQDTDDAKPAGRLYVEPRQPGDDQARRLSPTSSWAWPCSGAAAARRRRSAWPPPACSSSIAPAARSSWATWSGADGNAGGNALLNQQVAKVAASQHAVGRVAKRQAAATTSVLVDIRSTVMTGGVEGSSPSGV